MSISNVKRAFWLITPHIAAILVLSLTIRLAVWQLDRADQKTAVLAQWAQTGTIDLADQSLDELPLLSTVQAQGRFDTTRHVLLDNQTFNNHPGVHVFSLFTPTGEAGSFLINRGWQPWLRTEGAWPKFETPSETMTVTGRIANPPRVGLRLGDALPLDADQWPNLMTYLDLEEVKKVFGDQLADRIVLLAPTHPAHLTGEPWPRVNMGPERHRGYAFQWAAISVAIFIIWVGLTLRVLVFPKISSSKRRSNR